MTNEELRWQLLSLAEPDFQKFSSSLIPNVDPRNVLGVRLPKLRKIAKQLAKEDWRAYLQNASDASFEEIMLQGMVIGYAQAGLDELLRYVAAFIPKIDNWSVCDSFCSGLKLPRVYPDEMWRFLQPYLEDKREYFIRFGVVMLIYYYVDEQHIDAALHCFNGIRSDSYYVKMAVAWAVSAYYVAFPEITMRFLLKNNLDDFTYNKALQKITESLKVTGQTKNIIRAMKRQ